MHTYSDEQTENKKGKKSLRTFKLQTTKSLSYKEHICDKAEFKDEKNVDPKSKPVNQTDACFWMYLHTP